MKWATRFDAQLRYKSLPDMLRSQQDTDRRDSLKINEG